MGHFSTPANQELASHLATSSLSLLRGPTSHQQQSPTMPPRLPVCALRAQCSPWSAFRAFSSSPAVASPPREPPHPQPHHQTARPPTPSSSSSLLSISADRHKRAPSVRAMRPGEAAAKMMNRYTDKQNRSRLESVEALRNSKNSADYLKQMPRRWDAGDVYSPHDLSPVEMQKWRKRSLRSNDVVDALGIRPLDMYKVRAAALDEEVNCFGAALLMFWCRTFLLCRNSPPHRAKSFTLPARACGPSISARLPR